MLPSSPGRMGIGSGTRIPLWIPILMIILSHHQKVHAQFHYQQSQYEDEQSQYVDQQSQYEDQQSQYEDQQSQYVDQQPFHPDEQQVQQTHDYLTTLAPSSPVSVIPALRTTMVIKTGNSAHNHRICSTWGNFHFKTFDGDIYQFPGLCNYVFASHCKSSYEDFNIQIRRLVFENITVISRVVLKLDGVAVELTSSSITVNGEPVQLPYSHLGILMERMSGYLKVQGKIGVTLLWNQDDGLLLELHEKYANQTCGLCGDFNQISTYNEFISNNVQLTPLQFGNMQKMDGPTEQCQDPIPLPKGQCSQEFTNMCQKILTGNAFDACNALVDVRDYIDACVQDLCQCDQSMAEVCICSTFAEYSRQCSHAGGHPLEWRTEDFCPKSCPFNMQHQECGSPCLDSCTNSERSQLCEEHCIDGCFCPPGTVFDDINNSGCIPISDCYCSYNGVSYAPGTSFSSQCISCSCTGGQWTCVSLSCPGVCSIEGGSHVSTFDEKYYSFFGDCTYMFTKLCDSNNFAVLGEIQKCGLTESETCLKGLALSVDGGQTVFVVKSNGAVYVNMILTQLPISASNVTIFTPSSFFIMIDTKFGFQVMIQFIPIMQVFVYMDPSHKGQTCGLCGNFNGIQSDDFKAISGVIEGTPAAFANTWKTQADCPNVKNIFENPCTLSIENEKYALHWCGLLTDAKGPFQKCHSIVNPAVYYKNCMFDTCNCEKSENCMCAALSAYVRACAGKGILLSAWRTSVCAKFQICPETWTYHYNIETCQATCRALSEADVICKIKFPPVDGCTCEEGTYLDDSGKCVPASKCPCYHKGTAIPSGEVVHENGIMCTCVQGQLQCIGKVKPQTVCDAPTVYFDCDNATANAHGAECQKSCQTLDMGCYSAQCVSGCVCPDQLVSDGTGKCIPAEDCPCVHNEATYKPGETIKNKCNTCTCKNRKWICSNKSCLETCSVYGDGHYITFDGKRYSFNGECEYTLIQNQCSKNKTNVEAFRVITENIPCGSTGTTCSKAIKVFTGKYELILTDGKFEVIQRLPGGGEVPFKIRYIGNYMVIEFFNGGVIVIWDKKTSVIIKLSTDFKGQVCGLCGNYDGNDINDFTTRSQSVVGDVLEFGNSWKVSPTCPDVPNIRDPCSSNPYRSSWAQRQCSIINSKTFALCHPQVEPTKYYEACVSDACACDTGGDCECFCTAVAAYAQACQEAGVCISWRTPSICPLFCDYYNKQGECEWHYHPCGSSCMKTCRNPHNCSLELYDLEGCYPNCPADKPYFNEDEMDCVTLDKCGCFDGKGNYYKPGEKLPSEKSCQSCYCSMDSEEDCRYDESECYCVYEGKISKPGEIIYNTTDGIGGCITAICSQNGTIERNIFPCATTPTSIPTATVFVFTNTTSPASTTSVPMTTSICVQELCHWSAWYDGMQPGLGGNDGDFETFDNLTVKGYQVCQTPKAVECRAEKFPNTPLTTLGQKVECSRTVGLVCHNMDQYPETCHNYQIKILCCSFVPCGNYTTASTPETTTVPPVQTTTVPSTILTSSTASTSTMKVTTSILGTTPKTTFLPTSTTVPSTTEHGSPTTCKPICKWTEWYDVHFPTLDNEGDFETYEIIRATGKDICENPEHIVCRAEKFPNKTIDEIGQNVQCNISFGFVCRNKDQSGILQICYNYQIKVYCCNSECLTTPTETSTKVTTPQTISTIITTTLGTIPNITTPQITSTSVPQTTTITLHPTTTKYTTKFSTTKLSMTTTTMQPSSTVAPLTTTLFQTKSTLSRTSEPTTVAITSLKTTKIPISVLTTQIVNTTTEKQIFTQYQTTKLPSTAPQIVETTSIPKTTTSTSTHRVSTTTPIGTTTREVITTTVPQTSSSVITTTRTTLKETTPTTTVITPTKPVVTTTALPTTTHLPTPTTSLTTTTPPTTTCAPVTCQWSEWFDVNFPTSGPEGGDLETYSNIRAAGSKFCEKPINIQCQAVNHPDLSIEQLGQVVQCDVKVGLICFNRNQPGKVQQCFNFRIRVLCCEENPECKTTTVPPSTTSSSTLPVSTTTPIETMTQEVITTTELPTTTFGSSTSHCFCQIGGNIYMPGEIIYRQTDSDGCLYFAICGRTCSVERFKGPCVSTTPKPTSTPTIVSTTPTTNTPGTTPPSGCPDAIPPRQVGETWIENCTKATCLGNNNIVISKVECPPVQNIVCENGYPPVKVLSKDGCCYHYECECICTGWGDPHFVTFDGVYYTFLDNCTYVLVQQIIPKYNNFKILLDNYYCDSEDQLSCSQSIIIHYKSSVIVLSHQYLNGTETNKIYFNGKVIKASFHKDDIYIYTIGISMVVEMAEIKTIVIYSGSIFLIKVPFSLFNNNTEGQCGTCTNNIKDECRLPNGEITDCHHMATHWKVPDPKKDHCFGPTPSVPPEIVTPSSGPCSTAPLCSLILNEIFSECHKIIPPDPYFQGCLFDACHKKTTSMQCSGLEIYASLCASKGVCIDWRAKTNDKCPFSCPPDKVYDPCGPIKPTTCDNSGPTQPGITEGCFCKNGTKLFSIHKDICVSDCGCVGPDGLPKAPGETWISNCQKCTCEEYSLMVQCIEEPCPTKPSSVECSFEGFVPITILTPEEMCCPQKQCVCNTSHCPKSIETCPPGYELKKENLPGGCCINTTCVKVPGCVVNGKFYSPGAVVPGGLCESCICSEKEGLENKVECVFQTCDKRCPLGHEYQEVSGKCCGQCRQIACVVTLDSYPVHVLKPGETWYPPGNNCTSYECELIEDQYVLVTIKKACPLFDPNECRPEDVVLTEDGCCKLCPSTAKEPCSPTNITKTIKHNGCESSSPITVTYCEGHCGSSSKYSYEANMMDHACKCCQERKTTKKYVTLICPNSSTVDYSYLHVDECECVESKCINGPTPTPHQQEQQQQQQQQLEQQQ